LTGEYNLLTMLCVNDGGKNHLKKASIRMSVTVNGGGSRQEDDSRVANVACDAAKKTKQMGIALSGHWGGDSEQVGEGGRAEGYGSLRTSYSPAHARALKKMGPNEDK